MIAACLWCLLSGHASAESTEAKRSKKVEKILDTLDRLGISNRHINQLVEEVDARNENGYFYLADQRFEDGQRLSLRYDTGGGLSTRRLELAYTPENSHYQFTASRNAVMVRYRYEFK